MLFKKLCEDGMHHVFPNLMTLISLSVIMSTTTTGVKRGFSSMKLMCTKLRSSMSVSTLDKLMRIFSHRQINNDVDWKDIVEYFIRKGFY